MNRIVYDISHYQSDKYFNNVNGRGDGIILKMVNGTSGIDPTYKGRIGKVKNLIAVYSYGYAGTNYKKMGELSRSMYDGIIYLDIEGEYFDGKKPSQAQLIKDITDFFGTSDRSKWYIYGGYSKYKTYFKNSDKFDGMHYWMARYPSNNATTYIQNADGWLTNHFSMLPTLRATHIMDGWQFTSNGGDRSFWFNWPDKRNPFSGYIPTRTIKKSVVTMTGWDVMWVQWQLFRAGYLLQNEIDGRFGKGSERALINYQKDHHLDADGKCGPMTRAKLKAE